MYDLSVRFICNQYKNQLRIVYRNIFCYTFKMSHYSPISEIMIYCGVSSFELLLDKLCFLMHNKVKSKHNLLINCYVNNIQTIQSNNVNFSWSIAKIKKVMLEYDHKRYYILHIWCSLIIKEQIYYMLLA